MSLLLIDNYDSFTYNLLHYLKELGADVDVKRNDALTAKDAVSGAYEAIVISPGPCDPDQAGICLDVVKQGYDKLPIFGVCLGHQTIGQAFGGKVIRVDVPMHGKVSEVTHTGEGVFKGIPSPYNATRYHSLVIEEASMPECLHVTAHTEDGCVMGVQHKEYPVHGVQFHPESIASEHGHALLKNFLDMI